MDKNRLEYEYKNAGYNLEGFLAEINMSKSAYYRKCNGKSEFTLGEMVKILDVLNLSSPIGIFFAEKVS